MAHADTERHRSMNTQKPVRFVKNPNSLLVHSIFYTIQGEGPFSGHKALFIRLAGCNLQCPYCDTQYTDGAIQMSPEDIITEALAINNADEDLFRLVVITGGEPLGQDLFELVQQLRPFGGEIQIETNGTFDLPGTFATDVHIVCSPKTSVVKSSLKRAKTFCYKYVVDHNNCDDDFGGLPIVTLGNNVAAYKPLNRKEFPIYVTPLDTGNVYANELNRRWAAKLAMQEGYILQVQLHKLYGLA